MGFETQEEAERFAGEAEFRADQLREERMFADPAEIAWREVEALPEYQHARPFLRELAKAAFLRGFRAGEGLAR